MKKLAIGCGIVLLVIIAVLVAAGIFGARWMKGQLADLDRYEETAQLMTSTYGAPDEFLPPEDGTYDPERIALFARMRAEVTAAGGQFVDDAEALADYGKQGWFNDAKTMIGIVNNGMGFLATADSLLLEAGMGRGEFAHYQVLMLEGFFGESPEAFLDGDPGEVRNTKFYEAFEGFVQEYRTEAHRLLRAHARLAKEAADDEGDTCAPCVEWSTYLGEQLEDARTSRRHIPLSDPLPPSLASGFEAHRSELAATLPDGYGSWLLSILMVMELDDDEGNVRFNIES